MDQRSDGQQMIHQWIATMTEDYLATWSNKGLVKRGARLLATLATHATQSIDTWTLESTAAAANIEGHHQALSGAGFDALSCSCPAAGPCHHLTCFLLGLKELHVAHVAHTAHLTQTAAAPEPASSLRPWLIDSAEERTRQLGKASIAMATRWLNQELEIDWQEDSTGLTGSIITRERFSLHIPRTSDLAHATCSCKKPKCVHLACLILQIGRSNGIDIDLQPGLDSTQTEILHQVQTWLFQFAAQGLGGLSRMQLAQGEAFATELQQADMPLPGTLLKQLLEYLKSDADRALSSSVSRIRHILANLTALISALQTVPMPQPLYQLIGEHRRQYMPIKDLRLCFIVTEIWQTDTGFSGYTAYFYDRANDAIYSFSEARKVALDPNRDAQLARDNAQFAGHRFAQLQGQEFTLSKARASRDRRLSLRDSTKITDLSVFNHLDLLPLQNVRQQLMTWLDQLKKNLFSPARQRLAFTPIEKMDEPKFDQYRQCWVAKAWHNGLVFELLIKAAAPQTGLNKPIAWLSAASPNVKGIFGMWSIENDCLTMTALGFIKGDGIVSH